MSTPARRPKRQPRTLTAQGKTLTIKEWSKLTGLAYSTIYERRYSKGWTDEEAVRPRAAWFVPKGRKKLPDEYRLREDTRILRN